MSSLAGADGHTDAEGKEPGKHTGNLAPNPATEGLSGAHASSGIAFAVVVCRTWTRSPASDQQKSGWSVTHLIQPAAVTATVNRAVLGVSPFQGMCARGNRVGLQLPVNRA